MPSREVDTLIDGFHDNDGPYDVDIGSHAFIRSRACSAKPPPDLSEASDKIRRLNDELWAGRAVEISTDAELVFVANQLYGLYEKVNADAVLLAVEACIERMIAARTLAPQTAFLILHDLLYLNRGEIGATIVRYCRTFDFSLSDYTTGILDDLAGYLCCGPPSDQNVIQALYRIKARTYERLERPAELFWALCRPIRFDRLSATLDLGCGSGWTGKCLHRQGYTGSLTGIDLSPSMIDKARHSGYYSDLRLADFRSYLADCPDRYDAVFMMWVSAHLPFDDLCEIFRMVHAILCDGGRFLFDALIFGQDNPALAGRLGGHRAAAGDVLAALRRTGFSVRFIDDRGTRFYRCVK